MKKNEENIENLTETEEKPPKSSYLSLDDDIDNDQFNEYADELTNIMVTFNKDPDKARKLAHRLNRRIREEDVAKQKEMDRKIQRDFDRRAKRGRRRPNPRYLGRKSPYADPLADVLPDGIVPSLPPVPDELLHKEEEEEESNDSDSIDASANNVFNMNPMSKIEVGEKYGIQVSVPNHPVPSQFVATNYALPKKQHLTKKQKQEMQYQQQMQQQQLQYLYANGYGFNPSIYQYPYGYYQYPPYSPYVTPQITQTSRNNFVTNTNKDPPLFTPTQYFPNPFPNYSNYLAQQQQQFQASDVPQPPVPPEPPRKVVSQQSLMEQSGISIATPSKATPPLISAKQALGTLNGISIIPRDKTGVESASLQIGDKNYMTQSHKPQIPQNFHTSSGTTLTIGKISDIPTPSIETPNGSVRIVPSHNAQSISQENDNPKQFDVEKPQFTGMKTGGLVIGKNTALLKVEKPSQG